MRKTFLFIGDSLTEWGKWDVLFPEYTIINQGVAGDKTFNILNRKSEYITMNPDKVLFMAGINDLGDSRPISSILETYTELMELMVTNWEAHKIILLSVLPVDYKSFTHTSANKENIYKLNQGIASLAKEFGIVYHDMHQAFCDAKGNLNPRYTYDGLHLNNAGYLVWKNQIENYLKN